MANTPQAKKRARQNDKARAHNASIRSMARTYLNRVDAALESKDAEAAKAAYLDAVSVLDKAADKGIFHKNKAARHKSRMNTKVKALASS